MDSLDYNPEIVDTVRGRHGIFYFLRHDQYIGHSLATLGEYSEPEVLFLCSLLKLGDVVVEAGANIGAITVPLARAVGKSGHVYAFEPQVGCFKLLVKNIKENNFTNVIFGIAGLSSPDAGTYGLPSVDYSKFGNFGAVSLVREDQGPELIVRTTTIDGLELGVCDLIKIDVEGMERDVLLGAVQTIQRCRPILYVEDDRRDKSEALRQTLHDLGYRMWWHTPPLYTPNNWFQNAHNPFYIEGRGTIQSFNLFCVPKERAHTEFFSSLMSDYLDGHEVLVVENEGHPVDVFGSDQLESEVVPNKSELGAVHNATPLAMDEAPGARLVPRDIIKSAIDAVTPESVRAVSTVSALSSDYPGVAPTVGKPARGDLWSCIIRFGGLGDNLIAASPLKALKTAGYKTEVITSEHYGMVFENNPYIDRLIIKPNTPGANFPNLPHEWFDDRRGEFGGRLYHMTHTCEMLGAFIKAQSAFHWPAYMRRDMAKRMGSYLEIVHRLCGVPNDFGPLFWPTKEEHERACDTKAKLGGRFVLWVLCGTRVDKIWARQSWAIARIIKELNIPVVLMGAATEREIGLAKVIERDITDQNGSIDGLHEAITNPQLGVEWGVRRSIALATQADVIIGPDSGVLWAVAFEKMPKIVLLSHASPDQITKHWLNTATVNADRARVPCWPCHQLHDDLKTCEMHHKDASGTVIGSACINDISTETIVDLTRHALKNGGQ